MTLADGSPSPRLWFEAADPAVALAAFLGLAMRQHAARDASPHASLVVAPTADVIDPEDPAVREILGRYRPHLVAVYNLCASFPVADSLAAVAHTVSAALPSAAVAGASRHAKPSPLRTAHSKPGSVASSPSRSEERRGGKECPM